jgi:hypothetical protein
MAVAASAKDIANAVVAILRAQATLCNRPHDAKSNAVRVVAWVSGIVPIIVIIMRFASRHLGGNKFWWDDWLHLASVVSTPPTSYFHGAYTCARSWSFL